MSVILVTGAAGFIGFHVSQKLLSAGYSVVGFDNLNSYYDIGLKKARLSRLQSSSAFSFIEGNLEDAALVRSLFEKYRFERVIHLAAQAGVRHSIDHPEDYIGSNLVGFFNVLEPCRRFEVSHLVYASSSSVYGSNAVLPFSTKHGVDHPVSLYAATKRANELMAHSYSHLYSLPTTGLRFFTVYGPWGRPDMSMYIFTKAILAGTKISLFNYGEMERDFTYIDDIVDGVLRVADRAPERNAEWESKSPNPATSAAPFRVFNIGNHRPVRLTYLIEVLEKAIGKKAHLELMPIQPGDVPATFAEIDDLTAYADFYPKTSIEAGVARFVEWYRSYHQL